MEILEYSERGLINSLCYELRYSQDNLQLLNNLLSLVSFPYHRTVNFQISEVKILIEQSFSDFGDADLLLLVNDLKANRLFLSKRRLRLIKGLAGTFLKSLKNLRGE